MPDKSRTARRKFSWWRRLIYSFIPVLLLLGLTEATLTLAGLRPVSDRRDPYVGFSGISPLYEELTYGPDKGTMLTAESKLPWFNEQSFSRVKPPGTKRIFCMGGSTTFGRPYSDHESFAGWMRELLPIADNSCNWEVINAGGVSYASYRVAALMEELVQYQPDLFVVYSAHNEFLERRTYAKMFEQPRFFLRLQAVIARTRTFALFDRILIGDATPATQADILPEEVDERLNHTIGPVDYVRDPIWQKQVIEHYRVNLRRMVQIARDAGAQIVFVTPASNEKDCSPFKSEFDPSLSDDQRNQLSTLMKRAHEESSVSPTSTLELLREVLTIDPLLAEAHYRLGKSLLAAGEFQAAHQAFQQAVDQDICPLRALTSIAEAVRDVAQQNKVPIVDFQTLLAEKCLQQYGHQCLGAEYFLDHVHPDIEIHRELAMWCIDVLQNIDFVAGENLHSAQYADQIKTVVSKVERGIDIQQHGVALRNLAKVLHWAGKFEEAAPRASDALELLPNDPESRFVLADCLKNTQDLEGALQQYELLYQDWPQFARGILPFGELLVELGLHERAKAQLLVAVLREPDNAYAYFLLGRAHLALGETAFAVESFEKAQQLAPHDVWTRQLLDEARRTLVE